MVVTHRDDDGAAIVWCDPCLEEIVQVLNDGGLPTIASCCGHGVNPGRITLHDGREFLLFPNFDATSAAVDALHETRVFPPGGSDE